MSCTSSIESNIRCILQNSIKKGDRGGTAMQCGGRSKKNASSECRCQPQRSGSPPTLPGEVPSKSQNDDTKKNGVWLWFKVHQHHQRQTISLRETDTMGQAWRAKGPLVCVTNRQNWLSQGHYGMVDLRCCFDVWMFWLKEILLYPCRKCWSSCRDKD